MIVVQVYNRERKESFTKEYDNVLEARRFIIRCGYSVKLVIESISTDSPELSEYLNSFVKGGRY